MSQMITAVAAFLIDALIGDPRSKFHPVVLIGNLISLLEKILRRELDSPSQKIFKGGLLVTTVVAICFGVGYGIEFLSQKIPSLTAQI
ncbi:MAG: cobalamin biosynthesis protein, partial [Selenomonadaceae bacterium]|nr:cobalamin biosynthesis protein [Selenomonadaceae bacterium]